VKFIIVDTYYPQFLASVYSRLPKLGDEPYEEQKKVVLGESFGTADFYSKNLIKLGHQAEDIIANADILQSAWARQHWTEAVRWGVWERLKTTYRKNRGSTQSNRRLEILAAQIKIAKPDVLYFQDLCLCPPSFVTEIRRHARLIVGQIACPLPDEDKLRSYDLLLTSLPHYRERFRNMGLRAELLKIGFESEVLDRLGPQSRAYPCTFVGGFSPVHKPALRLLEEAARRTSIDVFGYGVETLGKDSPILKRHHGEVWGMEMYRALAQSKVTINRHIVDVQGEYANNMRLYEATGCGALLITDAKKNLGELFDVGREVVEFHNVEELCELIDYYKSHEEEREAIARAGQARTLKEHTYFHRMEELTGILERHVVKTTNRV
jgi:spore maturation protein CgeB